MPHAGAATNTDSTRAVAPTAQPLNTLADAIAWTLVNR